MDNYKINFNPSERESVLKVLSASSDVIINNVESTSAFITIQRDDTEPIYQALLQRIEAELNRPDLIVIKM
jgi:hypothetical protein